MSYVPVAQVPRPRIMEALKGALSEKVQTFSGMAKVRLFSSPNLKKMFWRVELPVL